MGCKQHETGVLLSKCSDYTTLYHWRTNLPRHRGVYSAWIYFVSIELLQQFGIKPQAHENSKTLSVDSLLWTSTNSSLQGEWPFARNWPKRRGGNLAWIHLWERNRKKRKAKKEQKQVPLLRNIVSSDSDSFNSLNPMPVRWPVFSKDFMHVHDLLK